jgi:hypothetical protein
MFRILLHHLVVRLRIKSTKIYGDFFMCFFSGNGSVNLPQIAGNGEEFDEINAEEFILLGEKDIDCGEELYLENTEEDALNKPIGMILD